MCCRYWVEESAEFQEIIEEMNRSILMGKWREKGGIKTSGEIRPTDVVPVVASNRSGNRAVFPMKWGFSGKSLLFNARTETAARKPTFKDAWEQRRCVVPASWYFEWEHPEIPGEHGMKRAKDPAAKYRIRPKEAGLTWLCGLYRIEEGLPVFVILTRDPGEEIRFIHDRMPLILPERSVGDWIRPGAKPEDVLDQALTEMDFEKAI